jgi:ElaB/YqjD/DUF883 family membrane-anchored ribosome-binding protein
MNNETNRIQSGVDDVANDTQALLAATADVVEEKVVQARSRLTAALAAAKDTCVTLQKKTVESAKVADKAIRENPYQAMGVAFGIGAIVGFLLSRRDK